MLASLISFSFWYSVISRFFTRPNVAHLLPAPPPRVTREEVLEIVEYFFSKNVKKLWKLSKLSKKIKIYAIKYNLLDFY